MALQLRLNYAADDIAPQAAQLLLGLILLLVADAIWLSLTKPVYGYTHFSSLPDNYFLAAVVLDNPVGMQNARIGGLVPLAHILPPHEAYGQQKLIIKHPSQGEAKSAGGSQWTNGLRQTEPPAYSKGAHI